MRYSVNVFKSALMASVDFRRAREDSEKEELRYFVSSSEKESHSCSSLGIVAVL